MAFATGSPHLSKFQNSYAIDLCSFDSGYDLSTDPGNGVQITLIGSYLVSTTHILDWNDILSLDLSLCQFIEVSI